MNFDCAAWLLEPTKTCILYMFAFASSNYFVRLTQNLQLRFGREHCNRLCIQSYPSELFLAIQLPCVRPLELLAPGPRLSKATEAALARYCESAVDARGDKRVVRTERLPPEDFCFEAAQVTDHQEQVQLFCTSCCVCVGVLRGSAAMEQNRDSGAGTTGVS